jgi:hypothetical protein
MSHAMTAACAIAKTAGDHEMRRDSTTFGAPPT